jgi:hypothetical protein
MRTPCLVTATCRPKDTLEVVPRSSWERPSKSLAGTVTISSFRPNCTGANTRMVPRASTASRKTLSLIRFPLADLETRSSPERYDSLDVGLSRKHVLAGMRKSLQRLQMDFVDIVCTSRFRLSHPNRSVAESKRTSLSCRRSSTRQTHPDGRSRPRFQPPDPYGPSDLLGNERVVFRGDHGRLADRRQTE